MQGKKLEEKSFACLKILAGEEKALKDGIEKGERVKEKIWSPEAVGRNKAIVATNDLSDATELEQERMAIWSTTSTLVWFCHLVDSVFIHKY